MLNITIKDITKQLESFAPLHLQESYDNCGLLIGDDNKVCTGVLICLDITLNIIDEAKEKKCNLIISHHPLIFNSIKKINTNGVIEKIIIATIKNDISIYAIHTNLDNIKEGVNGYFARRLKLQKTSILLSKKNDIIASNISNKDIGSGLIGYLKMPLDTNDFLKSLKTSLHLKVIKHHIIKDKKIHKVAICGGAGGFLISAAIAQHADAFISADIKYSDFFMGDANLLICDIGHYESEAATVDLLYDYLISFFPKFAVLKTSISTNPISYFF